MISMKAFLSDWLRTVRDIIIAPRKFFSRIHGDTDMNRPFGFALATIFFESLLSVISVLAIFFPGQTLSWLASPSFDNTFMFSILILFLIFLYSFFSSLISLPVYAVITHVLLRICGAHGNLKDTLRVSCYYLAMTIAFSPVSIVMMPIVSMAYSEGNKTSALQMYIIFIPAILIILGFAAYSFYILFVGLSVVHGISMKRVFAAVIGIPSAVMLLFAALIIALIFITGYSGSTTHYNNSYPGRYEPTYSTHSIISAPYGTAPQVDGYHTPDDLWDEADPKYFSSSGVNYTIAAKHDGMMLYLLIRWKGGGEWDNPLTLYFEQDGSSHDHDLKTGRNDEKYNGAAQYGPNSFTDAHFEGGVAESRDGTVRGNYMDGYWTQEWIVPLRSEDPADIYVDEFPATLGFAVLPFSGLGASVFPPGNAEAFNPRTWGDIKILDSDGIKLKPQPKEIVAASGKPPVIDGVFTPADGWDSSGLMDMVSNSAVYYSLAAKHDSENLYILVKWTGEPYYNSVFLFFEQDGTSHDHDLGTGRNDMKLNNIRNDYSDYNAYEKMDKNNGQNGKGISNYSNGSWIFEWAIPLCSGDENDLCIENIPSNLGFMVEVGNENIFFPRNASRQRPGSWGDLVIE